MNFFVFFGLYFLFLPSSSFFFLVNIAVFFKLSKYGNFVVDVDETKKAAISGLEVPLTHVTYFLVYSGRATRFSALHASWFTQQVNRE